MATEKIGFEQNRFREFIPYGHARSEEVEIDGKSVYFKSQTEVHFARILERLKVMGTIIEWSYEPKEFWFGDIRRGTCSYRPDFRVVWAEGIHNDETPGEVWYETKSSGGLRQKDITKYKRMANRYPDVKLVLVLPREPSRTSSKSAVKQRILVGNAQKYVHHVTYLTDWKV